MGIWKRRKNDHDDSVGEGETHLADAGIWQEMRVDQKDHLSCVRGSVD